MILYSTRWGAALSDDSYYYIHAARDWLAGRGFTLTPHFPPGLPVMLSLIGLSGLDPLDGIRWLNAALFGINILLTGWIILKFSWSTIFSLVGAFLFLAANTMLEAHSWAMSEPLYLTFSLLGLLLFTNIKREPRLPILMVTGLLFGLAAATRYIGISLVITGVLVLLTWKPSGEVLYDKRASHVVWFVLGGCMPLLLWVLRNALLTGQATDRFLAWHPIESWQWLGGLNTILLWISPGRLVHGKELLWLSGMLIFAGVGVTWAQFRERNFVQRQVQSLIHSPGLYFLLLYLPAYLFTLIIARTFFDHRIPLDGRLLSPVLSAGLIVVMTFIARLWSGRGTAIRTALLVGCLYLLFVNTTRSVDMVQSYHEMGRGYASARDHVSETYAYLRARSEIPVYSNAMAAIYFWTGRDTYQIPSTIGVDRMKADMKQSGAYLVIFDSIPVELYQVSQDQLTEGLVEQIRLSEASIYSHP